MGLFYCLEYVKKINSSAGFQRVITKTNKSNVLFVFIYFYCVHLSRQVIKTIAK